MAPWLGPPLLLKPGAPSGITPEVGKGQLCWGDVLGTNPLPRRAQRVHSSCSWQGNDGLEPARKWLLRLQPSFSWKVPSSHLAALPA